MKLHYPLQILATGRYLPKRVVTNAEVEELCCLCEGEIAQSGAGVKERRWVTDETTASMGAMAAREAMANARLEFEDLDLIINATGIQQQVLPDGAPLIQRELGLGSSGIACMSVHTTCLGFLTALDVCGSFFASGRYQSALIINSEIPSAGLNFNQPPSAVLFGDAATAVVVRKSNGDDAFVEALHFETYGDGAHLTEVRGGGTLCHPNAAHTRKRDNYFSMDGEGVYMMALEYFPPFVERFWPGLFQSELEQIDWVVTHQASMAAIKALCRLGVPKEKVIVTLEEFGNCVSASMPLTLDAGVRDGRIQRGHRVLLLGTGAGLSFGAMLLRF